MSIRYLLSKISKFFSNPYLLMFLNGLLLAFLFFFRMEYRYENGLFASIKNRIDATLDPNDTRDSVVIKAMDYSHRLMSNRVATFCGNPDLGPEATLFHSTAVDLMTAGGACGSYAQVLARIVSTYGYPVRIAQMTAGGIYAAHNIVEVQTGRDWVVFDPTYNLHFVRPDGYLASFADIKRDWTFYLQQLPADYDRAYRYQDVRYTNWSKIPVLFPALKYLLDHTIGPDRANHICLRILFLNSYAIWFDMLLLLYIPVLFATGKRFLFFSKTTGSTANIAF